jgi:hypothetical protein
MYKLTLLTFVILCCTGCTLQGEVYSWYDNESNIGVTNEIKF